MSESEEGEMRGDSLPCAFICRHDRFVPATVTTISYSVVVVVVLSLALLVETTLHAATTFTFLTDHNNNKRMRDKYDL